MSRTGWKAVERLAASLFGARRFWANAGARLDFEGPEWVGQVKNVSALSLPALEALALEVEALGRERGKLGAVVAKRSAGAGRPTPVLVVMTADVWTRAFPTPACWVIANQDRVADRTVRSPTLSQSTTHAHGQADSG